MKRILVVTPVLNGEQFIEKTIQSVISQTGDFQLNYIIKDGGSTDRTIAIASQYKDHCTIIQKEDKSQQDAIIDTMNRGKGEIGCWLNADDEFEPGALQAVIQTFENYPRKDWLYGRCRIIDGDDQIIQRPITWYKNVLGYFCSRNILICENFIPQPATFWRMDFWKSFRFSETGYRIAWDYKIWMEMARVSKPLHLRKYLARFRRHHSSLSNNFFRQQFSEENEIAAMYGNRCHRLIHTINKIKIISVYKWLIKT